MFDPRRSEVPDEVDMHVRKSSIKGLCWSADNERSRQALVDLDAVVDVAALESTANANAAEKLIAVTFLSVEYAKVGLNWIEAMRRLGWRNYLVVAGDRPTRRALDAMSIPCIEARVAEDLDDVPFLNPVGFTRKGLGMTALKFPVVSTLLRLGLSVIMSDADAVWLQDPMSAIGGLNADVAFQRVVYFPKPIARLWGFAACSGFSFFRSCPGTIELLAACVREHQGVQDDQVALNLALFAAGTRWASGTRLSGSERRRTEADVISDFRRLARTAIRGKITAHSLDVAALPHHQFWRHDWLDTDRSEMIICHPNTPKDDSEKMRRFEELGVRYV
jgi:hypothetical protein